MGGIEPTRTDAGHGAPVRIAGLGEVSLYLKTLPEPIAFYGRVLVAPNAQLGAALEARFTGLPGVKVVESRFEELGRFDCMVSAGNSFGLMDGGVDAAITRFFGSPLMDKVQRQILEEYLGEQPVGT